MRPFRGRDEETNYWPAVADVFVGFLALLIITGLAAFALASKGRLEPPPAKRDFYQKFVKSISEAEIEENRKPVVSNQGFSELNIYFPGEFLFEPCEIRLKATGIDAMNRVKGLLKEADSQVERVQVTGHTDSDRPGPECFRKGIHTNWELSARRAITVLELLAPDDKSGLDPRKVWAAALGQYHPRDPYNKSKNRRIEILVRFREVG